MLLVLQVSEEMAAREDDVCQSCLYRKKPLSAREIDEAEDGMCKADFRPEVVY